MIHPDGAYPGLHIHEATRSIATHPRKGYQLIAKYPPPPNISSNVGHWWLPRTQNQIVARLPPTPSMAIRRYPFLLLGGWALWELIVLPKITTQWPSQGLNPDLSTRIQRSNHKVTVSPIFCKLCSKSYYYFSASDVYKQSRWRFLQSNIFQYLKPSQENYFSSEEVR